MSAAIGFIGGGRIVRILLAGFGRGGIDLSSVSYCEGSDAAARRLSRDYPMAARGSAAEVAARSDIVFIALPPPAFAEALAPVGPAARRDAVFVSLAPKVGMARISELLGGRDRVARVLPNAPSAVGAGYNPVSYGKALPAGERASLAALLDALGAHPEVVESKLEAYAVLTAMGPAYFFFQYYEVMRLAVSFGLGEAESSAPSRAMLEGTLATVFDSGLPADEVLDLIPGKPMAPNEAAIKAMYEAALGGAFASLKA